MKTYKHIYGFLKETPVNLASRELPIDLCVKDTGVKCYDFNSLSTTTDIVRHKFVTYIPMFYEIRTSLGFIKMSPDQEMYCANLRDFASASSLTVGDILLSLQGDCPILDIIVWKVCAPIYALKLNMLDNCFVKNYLVGCGC